MIKFPQKHVDAGPCCYRRDVKHEPDVPSLGHLRSVEFSSPPLNPEVLLFRLMSFPCGHPYRVVSSAGKRRGGRTFWGPGLALGLRLMFGKRRSLLHLGFQASLALGAGWIRTGSIT